jgi:hypothetical protein
VKIVNGTFLRNYLKGKTVAVVGNSCSTKDHSRHIDGQDLVFRLNLHKGRLTRGYKDISTYSPSGKKTDCMAFGWTVAWNNGRLIDIQRAFPDVSLLLCVTSQSSCPSRANTLMRQADQDKCKLPIFFIENSWRSSLIKACSGTPLTGISLAYILARHNTAKEVRFYGYDFYTPSLNEAPGFDILYKNMVGGKKGHKTCGSKGGHNLTANYRYFKTLIGKAKNFKWCLPSKDIAEVKKFLL